ncbi:Bifunctional protein putA [Raoultella terrigena]|uniref:Bifunctional protein putA n=1 Tax=Raoultella terrigena TaxID=577 RepID=A0A4U9DGQ2_RAOTE|nr:Bifunctional protein putA [Raoultella terrigena]
MPCSSGPQAGRSCRRCAQQYSEQAQAGTQRLLPGPTGERNTLTFIPRDRVLCVADNEQDTLTQLAAVAAVGCELLWPDNALHRELAKKLPREVSERIHFAKEADLTAQSFDAVIYHGDSDQLRAPVRAGGGAGRGDRFGTGIRPRRNQPAARAPLYRALAERQYRGGGRQRQPDDHRLRPIPAGGVGQNPSPPPGDRRTR